MSYIEINRKEFIDYILVPASRFTDSVSLTVRDGRLEILTYMKTSANQSQVFFISDVEVVTDITEETTLHFDKIRKLHDVIKSVSCDTIRLKVNSNSVSYKSAEISFNLLLLDESVAKKATVSRERLDALSPNTTFTVTTEALKSLLLTTSSIDCSSKMYLSTSDGNVKCAKTDKQNSASDTVEVILSKDYTGDDIIESIISEDIFKLVASNKFTVCVVDICDSAAIFKMGTDKSVMKYIVPLRIK